MVSWDHTCSMFPCEADTGAEMAHNYLYDDQGEYPLSYTMGFRAPAEGEGMAKPFLQQQKERAAKLAKEKEEKEAREAQLHEPIAMPAASPAETRKQSPSPKKMHGRWQARAAEQPDQPEAPQEPEWGKRPRGQWWQAQGADAGQQRGGGWWQQGREWEAWQQRGWQ